MQAYMSTGLHALLTVAAGLLVLGILVLIHELGHFIAAKSCGIRVLAFSLGMGKTLLARKIGTTEYRLCAVPIGGYVQMAAESPEEEGTGAGDEFRQKPIWQRAVVAVSGPAANYLTSIIFLWFVLLGGMDQAIYLDRPVVGAVADSTAARAAGVLAGDSITAVNGRPVRTWLDVQKAFSLQDRRYELATVRDGVALTALLDMPPVKGTQLPRHPAGGLMPAAPARIGAVVPGRPAAAAGLATGDSVVSIGGRPVHSWHEVSLMIAAFDSTAATRAADSAAGADTSARAGGALRIVVMRGDSLRAFDVTPRFDRTEGRFLIGIGAAAAPSRRVSMSPLGAGKEAVNQTVEFVVLTFVALKKLAMREVSPRQLFGPVGIVQMSGSIAVVEGLRSILNLMAFVGVNLAVVNLLPLVVTDGGLLLYLLIEAVRRRPVSLRVQMVAARIAWGFFIALFIFLTFNDIIRIPTLFHLFGR